MTGKQKEEIATLDDAVKEVVKQKRPKRSEQMQVHTEPGDNTKYLTHSLHMWDWQKPDMTDNAAVSERIQQYFQLCADDDMKPSVEGMAVAFGTDRKTLWRWANGVVKSIPEEVSHTIKKAYAILNLQMADYMQNGKINPVAGIFLMKNNMAYSDTTEVVLTPNSPLGETVPAEQLAEKYAELPEE